MTISDRVRQTLTSAELTQAALATRIGLSESKLSKSLGGTRQFSAVELANIAAALDVSLHWLLTGAQDPMAVRVAARHSFDGLSGSYLAEGSGADAQVLEDVALLYRQAYRT